MWFKKRSDGYLNSREYESVCKKLIEVSSRLEELEVKHKALKQDVDNLRGNFNRKLKQVPTDEKEENINSSVIIPFDGTFKNNRF
jgi:hypothetical protein